jgi:Pretoxin HINT domain
MSVGDRVVGFDTASASVTVQRVTMTLKSFKDEIVVLDFGDNQVRCTAGHRFYNGEWIAAGKLQPGDCVLDRDGREQKVERVGRELAPQAVFNLRVEKCRTYFVGELGLLVHNVKQENGDLGDELIKKAPESDEEELRRRLRRQRP